MLCKAFSDDIQQIRHAVCQECALFRNTFLTLFCLSYYFLSISKKIDFKKGQSLIRQVGFMQGESTENIFCQHLLSIARGFPATQFGIDSVNDEILILYCTKIYHSCRFDRIESYFILFLFPHRGILTKGSRIDMETESCFYNSANSIWLSSFQMPACD